MEKKSAVLIAAIWIYLPKIVSKCIILWFTNVLIAILFPGFPMNLPLNLEKQSGKC